MAKPAERSAARLATVQALYQMDVAGKGVIDAVAEFEAFWIGREVEGVAFKPAETAFFRDVLRGTVSEQVAVDRLVDKTLAEGWPLTRVEAVLRAILRAGTFELIARRDVPVGTAISEYLDVAHAFYDKKEVAFVNGLLDQIAKDVTR